MAKQSVAQTLKQIEKERNKKERFIKTRTWFSTFLSMLFPDSVKIPENIGNRVFIGNNKLVTRNNISTYIVIKEFSDETPVAFMSKLIKELKNAVEDVTLDYVIKNRRYPINTKDSGLRSRKAQWTATLENDKSSLRTKKRAARLLYTVDIAESGEILFMSRVYLIVRAKDGSSDKAAVSKVEDFLKKRGIFYRVIKSKLNTHVKYSSLFTNKSSVATKDIPYTVQSATTLAELLPITQGHNDETGTMLGVNRRNRDTYLVNFQNTAAAKNILIVAPSGRGKTYLVTSWALDMYATGYCISIMDLKGNEYIAITRAMNGIDIPMRSDSTKFINTLVMNKDHTEGDPITYFNNRFQLTIQQMLILADVQADLRSSAETLITNFLKSLYTSIGVLVDNTNTWYRTDNLHPHMIYEAFKSYLSKDIRELYPDIAERLLERFKLFYTKHGSHAYLFLDEFRFDDIYNARAIRYDFGVLDSAGVSDEAIFKLRVLFMRIINNEYSRFKKKEGKWVFKLLEEAQTTEDYLMKTYAEEFALRRSQNQVTAVLTNSLQTVIERPQAKPILENANILAIGAVNNTTRDYIVKEYSLEQYRHILEKLVDDPAYDNTFFLINRMKSTSTNALLKIYNPDEVSRGKIYKVVDTI